MVDGKKLWGRGRGMKRRVAAVVTILCSLTLLPVNCLTPSSQIIALESLYNSTNGLNWNWKNEVLWGPRWSFTSTSSQLQGDPCNENGKRWQGIICSSNPSICQLQSCHIISILLDSYGLDGTLPSEFFTLTTLTLLQLSTSPSLVGNIPSSIKNLNVLRDLNFQLNSLSSSLPSELYSLSQLQLLALYSNQLTGTISTNIASLSQLTFLSLAFNHFTQTIPSSLSRISNLTSISLSSNHLTETIPSSLGTLAKLTSLFLSSNELTGGIPTELCQLSSLNNLYLYSNLLTGSLPAQVSSLSKLSILYLSFNFLTNTIPSELCTLSELYYIYLYSNYFTGPIPTIIGSLTRLSSVSLSYNLLTSTIPSEFGKLSLASYVSIFSNQLNGTLPSELSQMSHLNFLDLSFNSITGSIPDEFRFFMQLTSLDLKSNLLTGTVGPGVTSLTKLAYLSLSLNRLSGPLPSRIGFMTDLVHLYMYSNLLTSSIPSEIGLLWKLDSLYLYDNLFNGSIPPHIGELVRLSTISLATNQLNGAIPPEIGNLIDLNYLSFAFNDLTGTLPPQLGSLTNLNSLTISDSFIHGTIPSQLGSLSSLNLLFLYLNQLTGTIPSSLFDLSELYYLYLLDNSLTGSIPSNIGSLRLLEDLDLSRNRLIGPLPDSIKFLHNLGMLHLYQNRLTGKVVFNLNDFPKMDQFLIQQNQFHGSVSTFFANMTIFRDEKSSIVLHPIRNIDISDNQFSGSIPSQLFLLFQLETISLSSNCFEGDIPSSICKAATVGVISMDGLGSSLQCKNVVKIPFTSVSLVQMMDGSIPDCLWTLSKLKMLNLAGNGLSGTIGHVSSLPLLLRLTLSHNYLSGGIPSWLQQQNLSFLDLSHNKLTGVLDTFREPSWVNPKLVEFTDQTLKLSVNRLSGDLTRSFHSYSTLDILSGNLFSCEHTPKNDKNSAWAVCGSEEYDQSMLLMGGIIFLVVVIIIFFCFGLLTLSNFCSLKWMKKGFADFLNLFSYSRYYVRTHPNYSHWHRFISFGHLLSNLIKAVWILSCVILICSFPIYLLKVKDVESGNSQYITHSHMYRWLWTMAFVSGKLPSLLFLITALLTLLSFVFVLNFVGRGSSTQVEQSRFSNSNISLQLAVVGVFLLNVLVVGGVNGLYVWSTLVDLSSDSRILIQFSFGLFSFIWSVIILRGGLPLQLKESRYGVWLFTCLNVVNVVIIPCLVTALSDPSCYQRLLYPPDDISSTYIFQNCIVLESIGGIPVCIEYQSQLMDPLHITPPFSYSYQCGSTLLVSYIPVYIYLIAFQLISIMVRFGWILSSKFPSLNPFHKKITFIYQIIYPHQILSTVINNLILFFSFGLCSPALNIFLTLSTTVFLFCWLMLIGRTLSLNQHGTQRLTLTPDPMSNTPNPLNGESHPNGETEFQRDELNQINSYLSGINDSLLVCKWPIIVTSCLFVTLLCWDMVGDEVGWYRGLWVLGAGGVVFILIILWDWLLISHILDISSFTLLSSLFPCGSPVELSFNSIEFVKSSLQQPQQPATP